MGNVSVEILVKAEDIFGHSLNESVKKKTTDGSDRYFFIYLSQNIQFNLHLNEKKIIKKNLYS